MIRVAILGAGIGQEHVKAYHSLPGDFHVVRIIDRNLARAQSIADQSTTEVSDNIEDAMRDPDIDLVDICLPPHMHVSVALNALLFGKHVVCEKPIASSMADVARLEIAAKKADRKYYPVFQYRWGPSVAALKHLIDTGMAGRPISAALETHWSRDELYYAVPWRGTWSGEKGGAVLSHAIHIHDLLTFVMGPVAAVSAFTTTRVNDVETEDCAAIGFEMVSGALATSSLSLGAAFNETRLRFMFENFTATSGSDPYAPATVPWAFTARNASDQRKLDRAISDAPKQQGGFGGFLNDLARDIAGFENNSVSLADGAASIELVTAIYQAARSGTRVNLPLTHDVPLYEGWLP